MDINEFLFDTYKIPDNGIEKEKGQKSSKISQNAFSQYGKKSIFRYIPTIDTF